MRIKGKIGIDVLVNKENCLPRWYVPEDLIEPKVEFHKDAKEESKFLRKECAKALEKLFKKAKKAKMMFFAVSGYRSYRRQNEIFKLNLRKDREMANRYSAKPGESEHQTGLAIDITCESCHFELSENFASTKEFFWLKENVHKFGFIIRYPKDKEEITGYIFEPWHLRYVGKELAEELYVKNLTLEEYIKP